MSDLVHITDILNTLAEASGLSKSRVSVADNAGFTTLTVTSVGKREPTHVAMARLTKSLLDVGLVENLPKGSAPGEVELFKQFRQTAQGRDAFVGNIILAGNTDTMFTLSLKTSLPARDVTPRLHDALDAQRRRHAQQQIEGYIRQRMKIRFPDYVALVTSHNTGLPSQRMFSIHLENTSGVRAAPLFIEEMQDLKARAEDMFGKTTAVKLSLDHSGATLTVSGNPALLLDAIKRKDPQFASRQAVQER